jgi:regulator of protease activity HflC (stomatin/prohibitin superfamily)
VTIIVAFLFVVLAVLVAGAAASVRILREYERGVVFRLGRLMGEKGPGLILLIPVIDRMVRVDLRTIVLDIPPQDLITRDNVPARVNAVTYFRVVNAASAVVEVEQYLQATSQIAQTTLRSVLGKADLDMLLAERERLNDALQQIIDEQTDPWGVKVTAVEIKDVEIPGGMQRAMARQAEAERERRAKVIHAEGEYQASQRLRDAAEVMAPTPAALQLRYLQTLNEVGSNPSSTIVFPLPLDLVRPMLEATAARGGAAGAEPGRGAEDAGAEREHGAEEERAAIGRGERTVRDEAAAGAMPGAERAPSRTPAR